MKKLLIISIFGVIVAVSTSAAFGQAGYIAFGGRSHTVVEYSNPIPPLTAATNFAVTFLWAPGTTTSRAIDATAPTEPIGYPVYGSPWAEIEDLSGGWQFGIDATTGSNVIALPANSAGSFAYDSGAAFALSGSTGAGEEISIYAIAWDTEGGLYKTLATAEAADAPVGWSSVFDYTLGAAPPATPPPITNIPPFGSPEPATLALIGLGGLSVLILRRRKT